METHYTSVDNGDPTKAYEGGERRCWWLGAPITAKETGERGKRQSHTWSRCNPRVTTDKRIKLPAALVFSLEKYMMPRIRNVCGQFACDDRHENHNDKL
jgi:hypothetical protein